MRYGLPREEKPKKKWKIAVENELRCLKMEVCFLKEQFNEATNKLAELSSLKHSTSLNFMHKGFPSYQNSFSLTSSSDNKNFNTATPVFTVNNNGKFSAHTYKSSQENPFAAMDIEQPGYHSTWDYDPVTRKAVRFHSISCMPSYYKYEKSSEEIRYEDYVSKGIAFSNQVQRFFKLRKQPNNFKFSPTNWKPTERKNLEGSANFRNSGPFCTPWYLTPNAPKAPWPFGPSLKSNKTSCSTTSNTDLSSVTSTSSESNFQAEQNTSNSIYANKRKPESQNNSAMESQNLSLVENSILENSSSSEVLLELRKMGEQISTIHDRISKMDSNLSEVSSRVSVMDSRLSAVDMFVTMQRFDKKWQGLETRLAGLETPPPPDKHPALSSEKHNIKDKNHDLNNDIAEKMSPRHKIHPALFVNQKNDSIQTSSPGSSNMTAHPSSAKMEIESEPTLYTVTAGMNVSDFIKSISCTDTTMGSLYSSKELDANTASNSPSKIKVDSPSFELADMKSFRFSVPDSALEENPGLEERETSVGSRSVDSTSRSFNFSVPDPALAKTSGPKESKMSVSSRSVDSTSAESANNDKEMKGSITVAEEKLPSSGGFCNQITGSPKLSKQVGEPENETNSVNKDKNNGKLSSDPLGVTGQKDSPKHTQGDLFVEEAEKEADNEFVIVDKSDVDEYLEEKSTKTNEASSNTEFKMYNDITEYLEINLGKKKNLVYEFGFEAKPDCSLEFEGSPGQEKKQDEGQENKATSSADDSFQQFKINFIENKSVGAKQSSPFVFYNSKSPEKSPGKNTSESNN